MFRTSGNALVNSSRRSESRPNSLRVSRWVEIPKKLITCRIASAGLAAPDPRKGVPKNIMPRRCFVTALALDSSSLLSPWMRIWAATSPPRLCATNIIGRSSCATRKIQYRTGGKRGGCYRFGARTFRHQPCTQIICITVDLCSLHLGLVSVCNATIVAKEENTASFHILRQEVSRPKNLVFSPCFLDISSQPMQEHNAL